MTAIGINQNTLDTVVKPLLPVLLEKIATVAVPPQLTSSPNPTVTRFVPKGSEG